LFGCLAQIEALGLDLSNSTNPVETDIA